MRGIVRVQRMLKADPALARQVGERRFPAAEAELITELIERDLPFYDPVISEDNIVQMNRFAQGIGLLSKDVPFEDAVATQFSHLWTS